MLVLKTKGKRDKVSRKYGKRKGRRRASIKKDRKETKLAKMAKRNVTNAMLCYLITLAWYNVAHFKTYPNEYFCYDVTKAVL